MINSIRRNQPILILFSFAVGGERLYSLEEGIEQFLPDKTVGQSFQRQEFNHSISVQYGSFRQGSSSPTFNQKGRTAE